MYPSSRISEQHSSTWGRSKQGLVSLAGNPEQPSAWGSRSQEGGRAGTMIQFYLYTSKYTDYQFVHTQTADVSALAWRCLVMSCRDGAVFRPLVVQNDRPAGVANKLSISSFGEGCVCPTQQWREWCQLLKKQSRALTRAELRRFRFSDRSSSQKDPAGYRSPASSRLLLYRDCRCSLGIGS